MELAEEFGFDGVWLAEHHFRSNICPSILALASHIAGRTQRIRIGLGVLVLPFYHPVRLAEEVAVVDILTGGRLNVGVGRGYNTIEFAGFATPAQESKDRFLEVLSILHQSWSSEAVNFHGQFYQVENLQVLPKPLQEPHPPLWMAAASPGTVRLCGSLGIPFISDPAQTFEEAAESVRLWKDSARAAGHDPRGAELVALRSLWVADSMTEALADKPCWVPQSLEETGDEAFGRSSTNPLDVSHEANERGSPGAYWDDGHGSADTQASRLEELVDADDRYIVGDPETVVRKLTAYRDAGYSHVIGMFNSADCHPLEKVGRGMELFAQEVLPHVRDL